MREQSLNPKRPTTLRWPLLLLPALLSMLQACAAPSPVRVIAPPPPPKMPEPPVISGPQHTKNALPQALNYSTKVEDWQSKLREMLTTDAQK